MDIAITVIIALLGAFLSYLGTHATMHPPANARGVLAYRVAFAICGVLLGALVFWQGIRNSDTQSKSQQELAGMRGQLTALVTMIGPTALENQRRIVDGLAGLHPLPARSPRETQENTPVASKPAAMAANTQKRRLLMLAAEIFGCVGERSAMMPIPGANPATIQQDSEKQKKWSEESTSFCIGRLGSRIFSSWSEAKALGANLGDASFFSISTHDLGDLALLAAEFEKAANRAR